MQLLLGAGAAVNQACSNGATPLYIAARHGRLEVLTVLLGAGGAVNQAKADGYTSLMIAAHGGHLETMRVCLEREP
jgi:ankyrin repeat protein